MNKIYLTNQDIQKYVANIVSQMYADNWRPDYIVGITRGGLIPSVMLSHYTGIKMHTLDVRLRDGDGECESNCWMAEDAFGMFQMGSEYACKKILIVDDINDTGATFNWIMKDWASGCLPNDPRWEDKIWGHNVRFAALIDNVASECKVEMSYTGTDINKAEDPSWIVFPFEEWW